MSVLCDGRGRERGRQRGGQQLLVVTVPVTGTGSQLVVDQARGWEREREGLFPEFPHCQLEMTPAWCQYTLVTHIIMY